MKVVALETLIERDSNILNSLTVGELLDLHEQSPSYTLQMHIYSIWSNDVTTLQGRITRYAFADDLGRAELLQNMLTLVHSAAGCMDHSRELWPEVREQIDHMVSKGGAS